MSDARWRVWRTGNPSAGRGRAQFTRADDPGVSGPAERCRCEMGHGRLEALLAADGACVRCEKSYAVAGAVYARVVGPRGG